MSKYQVTYTKITRWLIPWFLRTDKVLNLVDTLFAHLQDLNDTYVIFTDRVDEFLKYDSRIVYFEKWLNDTYDNTLRRITVVNQTVVKSAYVYALSDVDTTLDFYLYALSDPASFLYPYVYALSDFVSFNNYNFKIRVPNAVAATDAVITTNAEFYVLSGIEFEIERF